jgi:transposase-like protein/IS1 family transposase
MHCPTCIKLARRFGRDRYGNQRYQCPSCGKTFSGPRARPLGKSRLPFEKAILALRLLLEGNSVRSTERLTGIGKKAIIRMMVRAGQACERFMEKAIRDVPCENIQCDEVWSFVYCKEKTRNRLRYNETVGDCYTFTAIERSTKLLLAYHVGKRDSEGTMAFAKKLRRAAGGTFQLSTDGFTPYQSAFPMVFGFRQDFAQVVKIFGKPTEGEARYSPAQIVETHIVPVSGDPDLDRACTSHIERSNRTLRMAVRRFTRLTDAFSKLWWNHEAAIGIFFCYYNFCRVHLTLGGTPAMAAGLTDHPWSVQEMLTNATSVE